jgi:hypothetical protein
MSSEDEKPPRGKANDSLTTRHIEQSGETLLRTLTTTHIQQKLETVTPAQNQNNPANTTSNAPDRGQRQGSPKKR